MEQSLKMLRQVFRNYKAWRVFGEDAALRVNEHIHVATNILASPSNSHTEQLIKVFGPPTLPIYPDSSGGFDFEDQHFDNFAVLEHHKTSFTVKEKELNRKFVKPSYRGITWPLPSYDEFWASEEQMEFRVRTTQVYCNEHADITSFVKWVHAKVKEDVDIVEDVVKEYGPPELTNDYEKTYELRRDYSVFKYKPDSWGLD